jgi:hypothetical protein
VIADHADHPDDDRRQDRRFAFASEGLLAQGRLVGGWAHAWARARRGMTGTARVLEAPAFADSCDATPGSEQARGQSTPIMAVFVAVFVFKANLVRIQSKS